MSRSDSLLKRETDPVLFYFFPVPTAVSSLRRSVSALGFPRGCGLRRLRPHPHRHLPHTVNDNGRVQCRRSLHQPDRHRSSVGVVVQTAD